MGREFRQALKEYQVAQNHFDWADEEYVDVAIYELMAKEEKVSMLARKIKKESGRTQDKKIHKKLYDYCITLLRRVQ